MADVLKQDVKDLMAKKDAIEKEIKDLQELLDSQKGVGMKELLIDDEGYPRSDIDVYSVRFARNRILCLQNDHKTLMKEIEEGIHALHAKAREEKEIQSLPKDEQSSTCTDDADKLKAFLHVDSVSEGSPSSQAGLKVGDEILKFGSIMKDNFQGLQDIASLVQHSQGVAKAKVIIAWKKFVSCESYPEQRSVSVTVERGNSTQTLSLTPNTWDGRGLLGCHIVPVK